MIMIAKVVAASLILTFCSWLAGKKPELAGFLIALPMVSILAILFSYLEHRNLENSIIFAKSILVGVPISLLFFLPFFVAKKLQLDFWGCFIGGLGLIIVGYFAHRSIIAWLP